MRVDTKAVRGRRALSFASWDEVVADAEKLAASPGTNVLGNWPLSQLIAHLATSIDNSIDGIPGQAPWLIRVIGPLLKARILKHGMPPGVKLPKEVEASVFPPTSSPQEALQELRRAVGRAQHERMSARHPVLGKLNHDQWTRLHLRHAELHLSYARSE